MQLAGSGIRIVRIEELENQRFDLADSIEGGDRLLSGDWQVLFHRHSCPACRDRVLEFEKVLAKRPGSSSLALIEVPPFDGSVQTPSESSDLDRFKLPAETRWIIPTPTELLVRNGQVVKTLGHN